MGGDANLSRAAFLHLRVAEGVFQTLYTNQSAQSPEFDLSIYRFDLVQLAMRLSFARYVATNEVGMLRCQQVLHLVTTRIRRAWAGDVVKE